LRAPDSASLEAGIEATVREAGALAVRALETTPKSWSKHGGSPVSEADIAVDNFLRERLRDPSGRTGWLSEETEDDPQRLQASRILIIDPIDGTRAYIGGRPDWSIATALVENGRPVVAVLYAPVEDEMFVAIAGQGVTINDVPINATDGGVEDARIAGPPGYLKRLQAIAPPFVALPKIHSLALRFARVAQGAIDAAFASGNAHDWDLAAADLMVHESGGALTTFGGRPLIYNKPEPLHPPLVAAGPQRHAALAALVQEHPISR